MAKYPTSDFIQRRPVRHRAEAIKCLALWKSQNTHFKYNQIKQMLHRMAKVYGTQITVIRSDGQSCYVPDGHMICLHNNSIITALHEFAHHLYGSSETIACRWSIWLFAKVFPEAMNKLTFKGHMLVRKELNAQKKSYCTY